jgi:hypothetical protein
MVMSTTTVRVVAAASAVRFKRRGLSEHLATSNVKRLAEPPTTVTFTRVTLRDMVAQQLGII